MRSLRAFVRATTAVVLACCLALWSTWARAEPAEPTPPRREDGGVVERGDAELAAQDEIDRRAREQEIRAAAQDAVGDTDDPAGDTDPPAADTDPPADDTDAVDAEVDAAAATGAAPPGTAREQTDAELPGDGSAPGAIELADPMAPVEAALEGLREHGISVSPPTRTSNRLQGDVLKTTLRGSEHAYVLFVLENVAADGYLVLLRPLDRDVYELVVLRARPGQERGLALIGVDDVDIEGQFRGGEGPDTIGKLIDVQAGLLLPIEVTDTLRQTGYRAALVPIGPGHVRLAVRPGRAIRRVRVHGHTPLFERELRRVLSLDARPGSLAPTQCIDKTLLRTREQRRKLPPLCRAGDLVCEAWEQIERTRIERYLFDEGYLKGEVRFAFACGKHPGEADLHVVLDKHHAFRTKNPVVTGNLGTPEQRWVRRVFKPTFGPVLPIPKRITRKHVEDARAKVEHEYAVPRAGPSGRARRALALPYPGVRVETNFDRLRRSDVTTSRTIELKVDVQLGKGVATDFLGESRLSENRLRRQLQLFDRREAANAGTASREAANLRSYYQDRGFMLAEVDGAFQDFGGLHKLTFSIQEGPRVRVRAVDQTTRGRLLPQVQADIDREIGRSRELRSGAAFSDVAARKHLATVLTAYAKRGYLCARAQVRVGFWKGALDEDGQSAVLDLGQVGEDSGAAAWLKAAGSGLSAQGLDALMKQRRAGLWVRVEVDAGPRVITSGRELVRHLEVQIPGSREVDALPETTGAWGPPRLFRDGPLRRRNDESAGRIPVRLTLDREVERDIVRRYQASGYPLGDAELRWLYTDRAGVVHRLASADRLTEPEVGLCEDHAADEAVTVDTELSVYEGRRARFGTTLVRGNFKTRYRRRNGKPAALAREIEWHEGDAYSRTLVDRTRAGIDGMGVTENVAIRQQEQNCTLDSDPSRPCVVHQLISVTESKDRGMDLEWGFGGATLDPLYAFVRPTFPNMWGTAWDLAFDAHVGANLPSLRKAFCAGEDCYERSARTSLTRRRIGGSPLTFDITGQVQRRVTPARGQIDSALGHVRLTWPVNRNWQVYIGYLFQAANISKDLIKPTLGADSGCGTTGTSSCRPPNRGESIVPDRTGALQTGARWEKVDNAFNPDDGIIATADAMFASPCLGGQDWWMRFDFGWEHFIPLPGAGRRFNFRYALTYGHEVPIPLTRTCGRQGGARTTSVPEVWRYFGGGTRDLGLRGILPQTMLLDVEQIRGPFGTHTLRPTAEGGHIRALGTVALQFVSVRNFLGGRLAHSVFLDFGVLTPHWRQVVFNRDFRRSVGVNFIKWDIRIVTVSLGYAVLVPNWIWKGNVRAVDDHNGRFVFDVGATF